MMKTIRIIFIILLFIAMLIALSACSGSNRVEITYSAITSPAGGVTNEPTPSPSAQPAATPTTVVTTEPTPSPTVTATAQPTVRPADDGSHPNIIGLYIHDRELKKRDLATECVGNWVQGKDIKVLEAYATQEKSISAGGAKNVWASYWDQYPDADGYKVGYNVSFTLNSSETISETIRSPEDAKANWDYIEVYLYDDIHQKPGVRYSHLTEIKDETICTSIKLTAGEHISEIKEIKLTAFVYHDDADFDPVTGNYAGPVSYEISIVRSE